MKRIYFDLCVYNRPFDDQRDSRIALETNIFVYLLEQIENGIYVTVSSSVLEYENRQNPFPERREKISTYLSLAKESLSPDIFILERAKILEKLGFQAIDALHLATSEKGKVDYFVTCDDSLAEKAKNLQKQIKVKVVTLVEFISEEEK